MIKISVSRGSNLAYHEYCGYACNFAQKATNVVNYELVKMVGGIDHEVQYAELKVYDSPIRKSLLSFFGFDANKMKVRISGFIKDEMGHISKTEKYESEIKFGELKAFVDSNGAVENSFINKISDAMNAQGQRMLVNKSVQNKI